MNLLDQYFPNRYAITPTPRPMYEGDIWPGYQPRQYIWTGHITGWMYIEEPRIAIWEDLCLTGLLRGANSNHSGAV